MPDTRRGAHEGAESIRESDRRSTRGGRIGFSMAVP